MLSNAYFLAKFRFDTAENEPAKHLQKFAKLANFADPNPLTLSRKNPRLAGVEAVVRKLDDDSQLARTLTQLFM